jgi:hypothetical protein
VDAAEAVARPESLSAYEWASRYSTSRDDLVRAFYTPAIERSSRYDRAVGFFRSSFFSIAGSPTASFALRRGRIRLLCSPDLTEEDAAAIKRGLDLQHVIDGAARRELDRVLEYPLARPAVELLAALIAEEALEIRFGLRREGPGIFHDKIGIFSDNYGNQLSFSGSVNETWQAWHPLGNHESFEVFMSWATADQVRVQDHVAYFERLWSGKADGLEVCSCISLVGPSMPVNRNGTDPDGKSRIRMNDGAGRATLLGRWRIHWRTTRREAHFPLQIVLRTLVPRPRAQVRFLSGAWLKSRSGRGLSTISVVGVAGRGHASDD